MQKSISNFILKYPIFAVLIVIIFLDISALEPFPWLILPIVIICYLFLKITKGTYIIKKIVRYLKYLILNTIYNKNTFSVTEIGNNVFEIHLDIFKGDKKFTIKVIRNPIENVMYFKKYEVLDNYNTVLVEEWEQRPTFFVTKKNLTIYLKEYDKLKKKKGGKKRLSSLVRILWKKRD